MKRALITATNIWNTLPWWIQTPVMIFTIYFLVCLFLGQIGVFVNASVRSSFGGDFSLMDFLNSEATAVFYAGVLSMGCTILMGAHEILMNFARYRAFMKVFVGLEDENE